MTFDPYAWHMRDAITQQATELEHLKAENAALQAETAKLRFQRTKMIGALSERRTVGCLRLTTRRRWSRARELREINGRLK